MNTVFELASMMTERPKQHGATTYGFAVKELLLSPHEAKLQQAPVSSPQDGLLMKSAGPVEQQSPHTPHQQPLARSQLTPARGHSGGHGHGIHSGHGSPGMQQHQFQQQQPPHYHRQRSGRHSRSPSREGGSRRASASLDAAEAEAADREQAASHYGIRGLMSITSGSLTPADLSTLSAAPQPHLEVSSALLPMCLHSRS